MNNRQDLTTRRRRLPGAATQQTGGKPTSHRWTQLAPLTGAIAVVFAVVAAILARNMPSPYAPGEEVLAYYTDNDASHIAVAILLTFSAIFLVFFVGALQVALRRSETGRGLSTVAFAGGVMMAIGLLIFAGLNLTLVDSPGALADSPRALDPAAAQVLNAMIENLFHPIEGGAVILLLASGIAIVRGAPLPGWLGGAAIVIGIVGATTPFAPIGVSVGAIWIVVVSIVLAIDSEQASGEPAKP